MSEYGRLSKRAERATVESVFVAAGAAFAEDASAACGGSTKATSARIADAAGVASRSWNSHHMTTPGAGAVAGTPGTDRASAAISIGVGS